MPEHEASPGTWEEAVQWLRQQPDQQDLVRDGYYDTPLLAAADRYWHSQEWQALRPFLEGIGREAIDIGAGRGIASYALAREGFSVTALEPDPSADVGAAAIRSLASETGLDIHVIEETAERLPVADASVDLVFARAVLHHAENLEAAAREFFRVLKPGGRLVAIREHVISRDSDLAAFHDAHPLHRLYGGEHAYRTEQYLAALEQAGFDIREVLKPLESPINFAPHSDASLKDELVARIPAPAPVQSVLRKLLARPAAWRAARQCLSLIDNRPGRLYSFVAERPVE